MPTPALDIAGGQRALAAAADVALALQRLVSQAQQTLAQAQQILADLHHNIAAGQQNLPQA